MDKETILTLISDYLSKRGFEETEACLRGEYKKEAVFSQGVGFLQFTKLEALIAHSILHGGPDMIEAGVHFRDAANFLKTSSKRIADDLQKSHETDFKEAVELAVDLNPKKEYQIPQTPIIEQAASFSKIPVLSEQQQQEETSQEEEIPAGESSDSEAETGSESSDFDELNGTEPMNPRQKQVQKQLRLVDELENMPKSNSAILASRLFPPSRGPLHSAVRPADDPYYQHDVRLPVDEWRDGEDIGL